MASSAHSLRGIRVLVVDDDGAVRQALKTLLSSTSCEVETAHDGVAALERIAERAPDLVITDLEMPRLDGMGLLRRLRERKDELPVIFVTGETEVKAGVEAMRLGAADYINKPIEFDELELAIERVIERRDIEREVTRLREIAEGAQRTLRALLEQLPDAVITASATGELTFLNHEAERILAIPAASAIGRRVGELFPQLATIHEVLLEKDALVPLPEFVLNDCLYAPAVRRMEIGGGPIIAVTLRDVTLKRRLDKRRLDFYSMVAHDLRGPLGSMSLRLGLMKDEEGLPVATGRDLLALEVGIRELVSLINDFLDIARSESVGFELAKLNVDLASLVRAAIADCELSTQLKEITIRFEAPDERVEALADPARLKQVISNLISNAVKFSPRRAPVAITVATRAGEAEFSVTDAGRGIADDKIAALFKPYTRLAVDRKVPGTGLGLMIVSEIIAAHGGTCGVESTLGKGSRFWFRLPLAKGR